MCKLDAVFEREGRWQVVDWKTGRAPVDDADLELRQLQLALYRQAYAAHRGIDDALVDAVLYFVADDVVLRPRQLPGRDDLRRLWATVEEAGALRA